MKKTTSNIKKHTLLSDFKEITKFGLSLSVMISSLAGYLLGADSLNYKTLILLIIGGYSMVGASNIYNQIIEIEPDKLMKRTKNRPLPAGRMKKQHAFYLAIFLTILGLVALYNINQKTALFGAISIFLYVSAYTPMKPVSPISVFVGAFPGAIPFMLGWVAATNKFGIEAGILFLIQFLWQFPHFWAIGWLQFEEYKKAGFNMMPTLEKNKKASILIIMYTVFMIIASLIPALKITGQLYLTPIGAIIVLLMGLIMLYYAIQLHNKQDDVTARKLMLSSVLYITLIQIIFVIDKFLH
ncbi:MAG TPA: protoheme IX farnesyltransferase [Flavobacteriia bacterium]|nr:protoheme IX farnesyltransferase [Flavobacteriia bacterium]